MTREVAIVRTELRSLATAGLGLVGLWSSVATSDVESGIDPDDEWYEDVYGNVYINNANDHDIALLVRPLRDDILLDCAEIERDPGRLLPEAAFGEAVHWTLPPRTNLALVGVGSCAAVWVAGEGVPPTILLWSELDHFEGWIPGQTFAGESLGDDGTALVFDEQGASWTGGEDFRFAIDTTIPELDESCVPQSDERIDWDAGMPIDRPVALLGLSYGPDGCFELELTELWSEENKTVYLCAPESALPFTVGDHIQFNGGGSWLGVQLLDPDSDEIALAPDGEPMLHVDLMRGDTGSGLQALLGTTHAVTPIPRPSCEWIIDQACPTAARPLDLAVVGVEGTLVAGDPTVVFADPINGGDGVRERQLTLVHAQERTLVDPICIEGRAGIGFDLDAVVVSRSVP